MALSQNDMTDYDDIHGETEIVFTATSEFDEHFNSIPTKTNTQQCEAIDSKNESPEEAEQPCDQDVAAQDQVNRLKAKLESNQALRNTSDNHAKQLRFRQLIKETRSLNKESEKFNTQSAVLLSALTNLKSEFEESETAKTAAVNELLSLSNTGKALIQELEISKVDTQDRTAKLAAIQQESENIVTELSHIGEESKAQQHDSAKFLSDLQQDMKEIASAKDLAIENSHNIDELARKSGKLLDDVGELHQQTAIGADNLEKALNTHLEKKTELEELSNSLKEVQQELQRENQLQLQLNSQSKNQIQQTEKLNEEQKTLVDLTQHRHEELRNELTNCLDIAKKYQTKLQMTETKLKDAQLLQERYKEQYSAAINKLESNETLLKNAAKALAETNSQNGKFNSAIANFQHTTEQSQQLVLRTQTTLESILTRNQLLERENKTLAAKLNQNTGASVSPQTAAITNGGNLSALGEFSFPDPQSTPQQPLQSKGGPFKFMVILAILIPLSFIAHSVFNTTTAKAGAQVATEPAARTNPALLSSQ